MIMNDYLELRWQLFACDGVLNIVTFKLEDFGYQVSLSQIKMREIINNDLTN